MAWITVVGSYTDGGGQFSETVEAGDHAQAERLVRELLAPRDLHVAGFFDYAGGRGTLAEGGLTDPDYGFDDPPEHEIEAAEDRAGWYG